MKEEDIDIKDETYSPVKKSIVKKMSLKAKKLASKSIKLPQLKVRGRPKKPEDVISKLPLPIKHPRRTIKMQSSADTNSSRINTILPNYNSDALNSKLLKKKCKMSNSVINPASSSAFGKLLY